MFRGILAGLYSQNMVRFSFWSGALIETGPENHEYLKAAMGYQISSMDDTD